VIPGDISWLLQRRLSDTHPAEEYRAWIGWQENRGGKKGTIGG